MQIILASSSTYRQSLLAKLGLSFVAIAPQIDESPCHDESPEDLAKRLSTQKALAIANQHPGALVIGSDQVASIDGILLGKPGDFGTAKKQLKLCSGREVTFYTGLCVHNGQQNRTSTRVESFVVSFRQLSEQQIESYLHKETPLDCAGSFKSEGLGICLFTKLTGKDPNSLIGLPLILLNEMLLEESIDPLLE